MTDLNPALMKGALTMTDLNPASLPSPSASHSAALEVLADVTSLTTAAKRAPVTWDARLSRIGPIVAHPSKPGAEAIAITDPDTYRVASDLLLGVKALITAVDETHKPVTQHWHRQWKDALAAAQRDREPLERAESLLKGGLAYFDAHAERLRREEQARQEQQAREDADRRRMEEAAALEAQALAIGDAELLEEAKATLETPIAAPVIPIASSRPHVAGIAHTKKWRAAVEDLSKFLPVAMQNPMLRPLLVVDDSQLQKLAATMKGAMNQIPGLRCWEETDVRSARR